MAVRRLPPNGVCSDTEVASLRSLGVPGRLVDCTRTPVAAYRAGRLVLVHRRPDAGEHILPLPDGENVIALQDEQDGTWGTFDQNHSATVRSLILKPAHWDPETTTMGMIERLGGFGSGGGGCSWNAEELMIGDNVPCSPFGETILIREIAPTTNCLHGPRRLPVLE